MHREVRIVHAADFHLGSPFSSLPLEKARIRRYEQLDTFLRMITYCREHSTDILLLAGDVIDKVRFEGEAFRAVADAFASIPDTEVFISPGNHDPYTEDSVYRTAQLPPNVSVFGGEFSARRIPRLGVVVWGAGFTAPRLSRTLCPPDFSVRDAGYPEDTLHLILLHGEIVDGEAKSAYHPIPRSFLASCDADYAALGHVHEPTAPTRVGSTYVAYSGCPEARGFDEPGPRGFLAGTISRGRVDLALVIANTRTYWCPRADISGCETTDQIVERILMFLRDTYGEAFDRHAYRITLTGRLRPDFTPPVSVIKARIGAVVFDCKIRDETHVAVDPELLRRENSLRGRFADLILSDVDIAMAVGDRERAARLVSALDIGLRAFEGEAIADEDM